MPINFSKRLLVGITGSKEHHWQRKLNEVEKHRLREVALFLECFTKTQRDKIYQALLESKIESIPLIHLRGDMDRSELKFLVDNFDSKCLNIHEEHFAILPKWRGFYKKLFVEFNYDSRLTGKVDVSKIGGFCVDLSHFKAEQMANTTEYKYVFRYRRRPELFVGNHLNGYSYRKNCDMHTVRSVKDFEYLKTLPRYVFGKYIALEMNHSIKKQLEYKKYLERFLSKHFN